MTYQLKVTLRGSRPAIWRRLHVPDDITLERLHRVLQVAMGWTDSHLHEYRAGDVRFGTSDREWGVERVSERSTRLCHVLCRPRESMVYEYDFGDGWEHAVVLEKVLQDERLEHPVVVAGERACPPEDVGGMSGFHEFLEAVSDPGHPEHEAMMRWCGGGFDPAAYELDRVNAALKRFRAKSKPRRASRSSDLPAYNRCAWCASFIDDDHESFGFGGRSQPGFDLSEHVGGFVDLYLVAAKKSVPMLVPTPDSPAARQGNDFYFVTCNRWCAAALKKALERDMELGKQLRLEP